MTWIRVDGTLTREAFIGALAEALGVKIPTAVGMWVGVTLGFAEHEKTGEAGRVTNASLESWAGWPGKPGKFAAAYRKLCVETRDDQPDRPGTVKLWWRQQALVEKMRRDADRLRQERERERQARERRATPPRQSQPGRDANVDEDDNVHGNESSSSTSARDQTYVHDYAIKCVAACNRGLRDNPAMNGFNELTASAQDAHHGWIADEIPLEIAVQAILAKATIYKPIGRSRQPTTLAYFDRVVRDAAEKHRQRAIEGAFDETEAALTEGERLVQELTGGKA